MSLLMEALRRPTSPGIRDPFKLRACRTCLETDAKLFNLHQKGYADLLGSIVGTPISQTDGLPQFICYYCMALLKKCVQFRLQCRKAHFLFQDNLLQKLAEPSTESIRELDRKDFAIPLTITVAFEQSSDDSAISFVNPKNEDHDEEDLSDIKVEPLMLDEDDDGDHQMDQGDDHYDYDHLDNDDTVTIDHKVEKEDNINEDVNNEGTVQAVEICIDNLNDVNNEDVMEDTQVSESENSRKDKVKEPSKKKKTSTKKKKKPLPKKEKKVVVKKEREAKRVVKKIKENNLSADGITINTHNKYNEKSVEDFEMFSKMYNVEVVFLTKEQQQKNIEDRKNKEQYKEAYFPCELCYKGFMSEQAYKKHIVHHDPSNGDIECDICFYRFANKQTMYGHMQYHKREYICKICNQVNKSTSRAKLHSKWHQGQQFECKYCLKYFNFKSTHVNHVRENHMVVKCKICDATMEGTIALAKHKAQMHSKLTQCPTCGIEFCNVEALSTHRSTEDGCSTEMRPCLACGLNFLTPEELDQHMQEAKHKELIFKCQSFQCSAQFTSERKLGAHRSVIHGEKQNRGEYPRARPARAHTGGGFMCEFCAKTYPNSFQLKYHQRSHTDERPYRCKNCSKSFRSLAGLKVHINTHTGERPYKCQLCPETFKSYSQKYKHRLMVHLKERHHKCHMCDKSYFVISDLKSHIQFTHMHVPRPPRNRNRGKNIMK